MILALGNFDGVHRGHQRILRGIAKRAQEEGGEAAVLTFYEHPQRVLHQSTEPALLTSPQHRLFLLHELGIEACFLLHFNLEFSRLTPEQFVEEWVVKRLRVKEVHMGYNAHFGAGRRGDALLMKRLSEKLDFGFHEAAPVEIGGQFVSSTLIRASVRRGDLETTSALLDRPFSLFASVVRGKGRGRKLGYPTANLKPHSEIMPPRGVYPVEVREHGYHLDTAPGEKEFEFRPESPGPWYRGILNFGFRPTFGELEEEPTPEVYLFSFSGEWYGKTVEVVFHPKLREEKKFPDAAALVQAIGQDVAQAQGYFREHFTKGGQASILSSTINP